MKLSSRPTSEEIGQVKAEGRQYGWLRSKLLGWPWPREGISSCGRRGCPVCDAAPMPLRCEVVEKEEPTR